MLSSLKASASAIIVAAGTSQRMGFDKLMAKLAGKPVLEWSLAAYQDCVDIRDIVLVCKESRLSDFTKYKDQFSKVTQIVAGGKERSLSVRNGLGALASNPPALVAVHDAARPLVTSALISSVLQAAKTHRAASAAHPVSDSLHRVKESGSLVETMPRQNLFAMETPQVAFYGILAEALQAHYTGVTDEVSALIHHGIFPAPVTHDRPNFKITYPQDLALADAFLSISRFSK
jgi:2-C-methyl-D-erythritol 4-phosphate cytidylyltransferase